MFCCAGTHFAWFVLLRRYIWFCCFVAQAHGVFVCFVAQAHGVFVWVVVLSHMECVFVLLHRHFWGVSLLSCVVTRDVCLFCPAGI